jgi:NADPH:quinone reductase-like Zn-dependent oxidoreductase
MKALVYDRYGPPEVIKLRSLPDPDVRPNDILVRVHASAVNTGDWRIRAGAFPGLLAIPAKLMFGIFRPRNPRLGSEFAGTVISVGAAVRKFKLGDRVFGIVTSGGAAAEYLAVHETAAVTKIPETLDFDGAVALPFGAGCALAFLSDFARLKAGQRLLVVGASGGVGCYAVQIGKALGADVTGVASSANLELVRSLGADQVFDYTQTSAMKWGDHYDVILDAAGVVTPSDGRRMLSSGGLFYPLIFGWAELKAAIANLWHDRKVKIASNVDTAERLDEISRMVLAEKLRPVVDSVFSLNDSAAAHAKVETRHRAGAVVLRIKN